MAALAARYFTGSAWKKDEDHGSPRVIGIYDIVEQDVEGDELLEAIGHGVPKAITPPRHCLTSSRCSLDIDKPNNPVRAAVQIDECTPMNYLIVTSTRPRTPMTMQRLSTCRTSFDRCFKRRSITTLKTVTAPMVCELLAATVVVERCRASVSWSQRVLPAHTHPVKW